MLGILDNLPAKPTWNYKRTPRYIEMAGGKQKVLGMGQK
jgi:hypothetical protein